MDYGKLGSTGLEVSRLCVGCMSFGDPTRGTHEWTLDDAAARPLIAQALEAGVTFFDTANSYSDGTSEEILGRALTQLTRREDVVIATKVYGRMGPGPNGSGLSRGAILTQVDASLRRLGTDYIDLYQIHRWDPGVPIEETLEALHDVVRAGKVRYLGASSMYAWQFSKALYTAERHGWTRFVSMQNHLNLLHREEEREMLPLCVDQGIGVLPWSPLARGRLARDLVDVTPRGVSDNYSRTLYDATADADRTVIEAVARIAEARGVPRAQVALAWVAQQPGVVAPIVGMSKPQHLDDAVAALSLHLSEDELTELQAPYVPHAVVGFG